MGNHSEEPVRFMVLPFSVLTQIGLLASSHGLDICLQWLDERGKEQPETRGRTGTLFGGADL